MIAADEDALICDLAETYRIYDYKALPVHITAALAFGLREDSRIKQKLGGTKIPGSGLLLAAIVDRLSLILWGQTEDGHKGRNYPKLILDLPAEKRNATADVQAFDSGEAFQQEYQKQRKKAVD